MGSHSLLQGISLTQGSNLGPLHCRFFTVSHQGTNKYKKKKRKKENEKLKALDWSLQLVMGGARGPSGLSIQRENLGTSKTSRGRLGQGCTPISSLILCSLLLWEAV